MEPWHVAVAIKPFVLVALFFGVALIALAIKQVFPESALKAVLFDKSFRERKPKTFTAIVLVVYVGMMVSIFLYYGVP